MFEYDWTTHMLSSDDNVDSSSSDHHHHYPYPYPDPTQLGFTNPNYSTQPHNFHNPNEPTHHLINPLSIWPYSPAIMNHHHDPNHDPTHFIMVPKAEPLNDYGSGIGLNLGGRTYFSSAENEFVNRLYRGTSTRQHEGSLVNVPRCQVEGCGTELTHAKHYHRRHKVCEFHSKAAVAAVAGLTQRFCQQCSRFHLLMEFDNGKRSCRKRLADHNRRRRKSNKKGANANQDQHNQLALLHSPSDIARSPQDSVSQSTSSSSMAISSPGISFDYFRQGSY